MSLLLRLLEATSPAVSSDATPAIATLSIVNSPTILIGSVSQNTTVATETISVIQPTIIIGPVYSNAIAANITTQIGNVSTARTINSAPIDYAINVANANVAVAINATNVAILTTSIITPTVYSIVELNTTPPNITVDISNTTISNAINVEPYFQNIEIANVGTEQLLTINNTFITIRLATLVPHNYKANFSIENIPTIYINVNHKQEYGKVDINNIPSINTKGSLKGV